MNNAFVRFGRTCASMAIAGGLVAGALLAGSLNPVTVTLPHAVTVGSITLPSGEYTLSSLDMSDGDEYFVIRGAHTPTVTLAAQKIDASGSGKTQVVFSHEGATWHFEKLFVEGNASGFQFVNIK